MKLYTLINPDENKSDAITDFLPLDSVKTGNAIRCPKCNKFMGMLPLLPPIKVEIELFGNNFGDIAFGTGDQILISETLKKLFINNNLVGLIDFLPAEIIKVKYKKKLGKLSPNYYLTSVVQGNAVIDDKMSNLIREEPWICTECHIGGIIKKAKKIVFEKNTWSGEDIFIARGLPGTIFVSEKFKELCEKNSLKNCMFIEISKYNFDFYP